MMIVFGRQLGGSAVRQLPSRPDTRFAAALGDFSLVLASVTPVLAIRTGVQCTFIIRGGLDVWIQPSSVIFSFDWRLRCNFLKLVERYNIYAHSSPAKPSSSSAIHRDIDAQKDVSIQFCTSKF